MNIIDMALQRVGLIEGIIAVGTLQRKLLVVLFLLVAGPTTLVADVLLMLGAIEFGAWLGKWYTITATDHECKERRVGGADGDFIIGAGGWAAVLITADDSSRGRNWSATVSNVRIFIPQMFKRD